MAIAGLGVIALFTPYYKWRKLWGLGFLSVCVSLFIGGTNFLGFWGFFLLGGGHAFRYNLSKLTQRKSKNFLILSAEKSTKFNIF